jgi:hypothetical protein
VPVVDLSSTLSGLAVLALAQLEIVLLRKWEEITQLVCGIWLIVPPLITHLPLRTSRSSQILALGTWRHRFALGFGNSGALLM